MSEPNEGSMEPTPEGVDEEQAPGFDRRLERLEALVSDLEEGGLDLEAALALYEEGVGLLGACRETLTTYRRRVEELTRGAELALEPYTADPDARA